MSLSFSLWSRPTVCPLNLEDGPQILALFIFFDIPFNIFSAAEPIVEFGLRIIGLLLGSFFGSLVYTRIMGNVSKIIFFNSSFLFPGFFELMSMLGNSLNFD